MIARALRSPSAYLPGIVLAVLAIAMWSSGWFWVLLLVAAFAVAPWFAASRLLDDKAELTTALSAALAEHANCPAPVERFVEVARAADERRLRSVPPQRDGSEYEWPRIARVLDIEEGS